ncbi:hypothetical protein HK096_006962, partial [Nowakowskiella sp. JEL0078]
MTAMKLGENAKRKSENFGVKSDVSIFLSLLPHTPEDRNTARCRLPLSYFENSDSQLLINEWIAIWTRDSAEILLYPETKECFVQSINRRPPRCIEVAVSINLRIVDAKSQSHTFGFEFSKANQELKQKAIQNALVGLLVHSSCVVGSSYLDLEIK